MTQDEPPNNRRQSSDEVDFFGVSIRQTHKVPPDMEEIFDDPIVFDAPPGLTTSGDASLPPSSNPLDPEEDPNPPVLPAPPVTS